MRRRIHGMTLVELLVVLAILAGLATVAVINSAGLQERICADETVALGEEISEAWQRAEGRSFLSDFGELPNDIARLQLLFFREYPAEIKADASPDGPGFIASRGGNKILRKEAPLYGRRTSQLFPGLIYADARLPGIGAAELTKLNRTFLINLPCGWRGPYCSAKLFAENGIFLDAFGHAWHLQWENTDDHKDDKDVSLEQKADKHYRTANRLVSRGADGSADAAVNGLHAWQDTDLIFPLEPPHVSLTVTLEVPSGVNITEAHVYMYYPEMSWPTKPADDKNQPTLRIACRYFAEALAGSGVISQHLTAGTRAFFVWADTSDGIYWLPPRYMTLQSGNNSLKGFLRKAAK